MKKKLIIIFVAILFLIALHLPYTGLHGEILLHLSLLPLAVIIGVIISHFLESSLTEEANRLTSNLSEKADTFRKDFLDKFEDIFKSNLIPVISKAIRSPEILDAIRKSSTEKAVSKEREKKIEEEDVRRLVDVGRQEEAERIVKERLDKSKTASTLLELVDVLLTYIKRNDIKRSDKNDEAKQYLEKEITPEDLKDSDLFHYIRSYLRLAFNYFSDKDLPTAIELGEAGLKMALKYQEKANIDELTPKFKNSLAYYYADIGKDEYEKPAREYSKEAMDKDPDNPPPIDTRGYVLITYGKDRQEISEGMKLCHKALSLRPKIDDNALFYYKKHIDRGTRRLSSLT